MTFDRRTPGQLRAALALTEEARVNLEARVARMEPMWAAGHAFCAAWLSPPPDGGDVIRALRDDMLSVHGATTPSPTPPTHVVIAVDELERLKAIARAADEWAAKRVEDGRIMGRSVIPTAQRLLDALAEGVS